LGVGGAMNVISEIQRYRADTPRRKDGTYPLWNPPIEKKCGDALKTPL